jgi:uncharacterized membrane protein
MALFGRSHPLLIHFPIALLIGAAAAEAAAAITRNARWRDAAVISARAGAVFAALAAAAGWRLSLAPAMAGTPLLGWHQWSGVLSAVFAAAAAAGAPSRDGHRPARRWAYRAALLGAAVMVAIAGHLGGQMVWGADFLRP